MLETQAVLNEMASQVDPLLHPARHTRDVRHARLDSAKAVDLRARCPNLARRHVDATDDPDTLHTNRTQEES